MSLKRLKLSLPNNSRLNEVINKITDLSMRSNLTSLSYSNSPTLFQNQSLLLDAASKTPNSFLTISNGIYETSIFISRNLLEQTEQIFKNESLKLKVTGLSSITLILPKEAIDTPGIHFSVFKKLFSGGVNVFETATSFTELTIFLRSEDTEKAFGVLKKLS
jgi:aspartokinase